MLMPSKLQSALEYLTNLPALLSSAASCNFAFLPAYASTNLQQSCPDQPLHLACLVMLSRGCSVVAIAMRGGDVDALKRPVSLEVPYISASSVEQGCILQLCLLASICIHKTAAMMP